METTLTVNQIELQEPGFELSGTGPDFDAGADDSVLETFEFLGAAGFGREGRRSLAVDMLELS